MGHFSESPSRKKSRNSSEKEGRGSNGLTLGHIGLLPYAPTASGFPANNCLNTYCKIPPLA